MRGILFLIVLATIGCGNPFGENDTAGGNVLENDIIAPTAPTNLGLSGTPLLTASPTLTWTSATDDREVKSYEIGIGTSTSNDNVVAFQDIGKVNSHQITGIAPSLSSSQTYYLLIKTTDTSSNESTIAASASWSPGLVTDTGALQTPETQAALANCNSYINSAYYNADGDGIYWIDPDGAGGGAKFKVYCEMTTDGGGWTLVDNVAAAGQSFASRVAGANTDLNTTRGSLLPSYFWSGTPQLMCKSSQFTGSQNWLTFNVLTATARDYPTVGNIGLTGAAGHFSTAILNGNTDRGASAWIYIGSGRIGSVWIGNGSNPTCACNYAGGASSGLGSYVNNNASCSTWVR